jgi:hypothetical protein
MFKESSVLFVFNAIDDFIIHYIHYEVFLFWLRFSGHVRRVLSCPNPFKTAFFLL